VGLAGLVSLRDGGQPTTGLANLVLEGGAGSGRGTVARVYAWCLADLGLVRTRAVHEAALSSFPGRWDGQPEFYARSVFAEADGGVLLLRLDAAFAAEPAAVREAVLTALPKSVAAHPGVVVLLAVEPAHAAQILRGRADLLDCFAESLTTGEYTASDLALLAGRHLVRRGLRVDDAALAELTECFGEAPSGTGADVAHALAAGIGQIVASPAVRPEDVRGVVGEAFPAAERAPELVA
jgi:hypothetical protein